MRWRLIRGMAEKGDYPDGRVAEIAEGQHGVVSIEQLRDAGLSDDAVSGRCRAGRLHRVHRGVYAVGHPRLSDGGRWMAAVLACGGGAVLSHRSAAALWGMLAPAAGATAVDVSVPSQGGRRKRVGIRLHRRASLRPEEMTCRSRIPVTTPARTIADLRRIVPAAQLRHAIRQAEVLGLRTGLAGRAEPTRSELEDLFLGLCRRHRLPRPEVNVWIGSMEVDFLWRERRLIVETDGYRYHRGRTAFEEDRERDLRLKAHGYQVLRLSYRQLVDSSARVAESLRGMLAEVV